MARQSPKPLALKEPSASFVLPNASANLIFFNLRGAFGSPVVPDVCVTSKFRSLDELIRSSAIGFCFEAHGKHYNQLALELAWSEFFVFLAKHPTAENSGGVLVTVSREWAGRHFASASNFRCLEPGRIAAVELRGPHGGLDAIGIHLEPALGPLAKRSIMTRISQCC